MTRIFVCSPFRSADPEIQRKNIRVVKAICRKIALGRDIPFAPHLHFPRFLSENGERDIGMRCAIDLLTWWAEKIAVWPPVLTEGMDGEIAQAIRSGIKVWTLPQDFLDDEASVAYLAKLEEEDEKIREAMMAHYSFTIGYAKSASDGRIL